MRTLQEKYNGIQQGKFSKDHFLAEARMQQPQLITRFNGYDDAVQILKNKGMLKEGMDFSNHSNDAITDMIVNLSRYEGNEQEIKAAKDELARRKQNLKEAKQPKATKKGLADYRYKPTNEMDKYPYEQILRGLRVELEQLGVQGTPTAEQYTKALAKVSKNLAKDSIFYTNQVAGVNPNVDLHDKMVPVTAKNTVDTFNGMKKAALKEGFKKLIKKVLSENMGDMFGDEETAERSANYGQPGEDEYDFYSNPENYKDEDDMFEMYGEDTLDESAIGDIHILAQESGSLKDFLQSVKAQHPGVDLRRDIEELQHIWNNREQDQVDYDDIDISDSEIDYDDENFSDPFIDGEDDLFEGKKSLSQLLK